MKLVLDTNVVLDLLHWRDPRCDRIAAALAEGRATCFTDEACLAELERVLGYPKFGLDPETRTSLYESYCRLATCIAPPAAADDPPALPRCRDADDQKFMELAARCAADFLLTRDRELLRLARSRRHPPPFAILLPEHASALIEPSPTFSTELPT